MKKLNILAGLALVLLAGAAQAKDWTEIRIATEGAYPPFNFVAADGSLQGLDVDIANALCEEVKAKCTIVAQDWDGIIPGLLADKYDAVVASMTITEERKKQVAFIDKYYSTPLSVILPKDSPIGNTDPVSFNGKTIGAQGGTTQADYSEDVYGKAGAEVKLYPTADEANADLVNGRLDAVVSDKFPAAEWIKKNGSECCKMLGDIPGTQSETGIAVRQGDNDLREKLNAAITAIRANGTYDKIVGKYFDFDIY